MWRRQWEYRAGGFGKERRRHRYCFGAVGTAGWFSAGFFVLPCCAAGVEPPLPVTTLVGARLLPDMTASVMLVAMNRGGDHRGRPGQQVGRRGAGQEAAHAAAPAAADAQRAAFAALQEHHADQGEGQKQMNDQNDEFHIRSAAVL